MSVQTLTTVGYGSLFPTSARTWVLAAVAGVFGFSHDDLRTRRAELLLIIKGIDEGYMQPVIARHSFRYDEIAWGGRFVRAYGVESGEARLYLSKISSDTPETAPERLPS